MPSLNSQQNNNNVLTNGVDIEELKKQLPHVDMETGLKNRIVKRDPITGLGASSKEHVELGRRRTSSARRQPPSTRTLISWNADAVTTDSLVDATSKTKKQVVPRNPIALTGELGAEVDALRRTTRTRNGNPREPQRDPIAGRGNFGACEWDPIGKYNGRTRRAKSTNCIRSNPLTGENMKAFNVMLEERTSDKSSLKKKTVSSRNVLTGENCSEYLVCPGMKQITIEKEVSSRNAITGEDCPTYDFNSEITRPTRKSLPGKSSNPLCGENVATFMVSQEERPRISKPYVYTNTLTGENLTSYKITPLERNVTVKPLKEKQNPLSGENIKSFKYRVGEGQKTVKKRDISSPLTGEGSRGRTYIVSFEEKKLNGPELMNNDHGAKVRARSSGSARNVLTGENCEAFYVCQEMRSERPKLNLSNGNLSGIKSSYNIITGQVY